MKNPSKAEIEKGLIQAGYTPTQAKILAKQTKDQLNAIEKAQI